MTRSNKRKGETLEAPTKKSNKENTFDSGQADSQRRSARDRSLQKTPYQQLEEISSVISGIGQPNSKHASPSILDSVAANPMAPLASTSRKRSNHVVSARNGAAPSTVDQSATLGVPNIDMQQFASMVTGNAPVDGSAYNLRLPTPAQSQSPLNLQIPARDSFPPSSQLSQTVAVQPVSSGTGSQILGSNSNAAHAPGVSYDFMFNSQARYPSPTGMMQSGSNNDAYAAYNMDIGSTPDIVYGWLQERQSFDAESTGALHNMAYSSQAFTNNGNNGNNGNGNMGNMINGNNGNGDMGDMINGNIDWATGDGYISDGSDDNQRADDELSDSSEEEMAIPNSCVAPDIGTSSVSTLDSSLLNALGTPGPSGRFVRNVLGTNVNIPAMSKPLERPPRVVHQPLPSVAVPQKAYSVLEDHYERNRRPHPPTTDKLKGTARSSGSFNSGPGPVHRNPSLQSTATGGSVNHIQQDGGLNRIPEVDNSLGGASRGADGGVLLQSAGQTSVEAGDHATNDILESDDEGESEIDVPVTRAPRFSKTPRASKPPDPTKSEFYPVNWQTVLRIAKMLLRRWVAIQVPFPNRRQHFGKMRDFIHRALEIHQSGGGHVEDGYYENHLEDMQKLLWDEIANFRGTIKQLAREAILGYDFKPVDIEDKNAYKAQLIANVRELKHDAFFLRDGVDANGSTNNFCHRNFRQATLASFYSSYSKLAAHFPEDFNEECPRQAKALVATAMICAFDEWLSGRRKTINFSGEKYAAKLVDILDLMANLEADPVQARKLRITRRLWARMGRNDVDDGEVNNGFAVAL